ncbi:MULTISPECIES: hypothetical protein [Staphylococcus]|uniref:hypothetical protein n=1 Tax=Staphylococcus TaxID=1279 RepID=UPI0008FBB9EE|nr:MULTISPECIES: hypothetical protein [Staphylococcus]MBL0377639.1 hypothetical protein [Staphylococcus sp. S75]MBL0401955.1 hypothetical protein [Staphylococcus sp. S36]MDV3052483.1 hypothetical protein [Staphylococcus ureilyticus]OIS31401.1 hypothetical protein RES9_01915 [Staphylococcus cohnii]OIS32317.1 hypothetical protein RES10_04595 [Staphylococcus cohnii]
MSNINIFEWNHVKSKIKEIREEIDDVKQQNSIDKAKNRQLTNVLRELSVVENMVNELMDYQKEYSAVNKIKNLIKKNKERYYGK